MLFLNKYEPPRPHPWEGREGGGREGWHKALVKNGKFAI